MPSENYGGRPLSADLTLFVPYTSVRYGRTSHHANYGYIMWIMRYLKNTIKYAIVYRREIRNSEKFVVYCDSSFAGERKSKSRYGFAFKFLGALVSWTSAKSTRVLTSSTEAECNALVHTAKENTWMREFVRQLEICRCDDATIMYQDNKRAYKEGWEHL